METLSNADKQYMVTKPWPDAYEQWANGNAYGGYPGQPANHNNQTNQWHRDNVSQNRVPPTAQVQPVPQPAPQPQTTPPVQTTPSNQSTTGQNYIAWADNLPSASAPNNMGILGQIGSFVHTGLSNLFGGNLGVDHSSYLKDMYAAALDSQLAQLEASYNQNVSDLDASVGTVNDAYTEQKRQATGDAARDAAGWREMANAYGLNSGAIGQAALAQNNQLQSNLNTLANAQAAALADIERQRTLLGRQYQLQINQAIADNNFELANALYQEAVRQDQLADEAKGRVSSGYSYRSSGSSKKSTSKVTAEAGTSTKKETAPKTTTTSTPTVETNDVAYEVLQNRLEQNDYTADQQVQLIERYLENDLITNDEAGVLLNKVTVPRVQDYLPVKQMTR